MHQIEHRLNRISGRISALKSAGTFDIKPRAEAVMDELQLILIDIAKELRSLNLFADLATEDIQGLADRTKTLERRHGG
jgi:hypothetical protein